MKLDTAMASAVGLWSLITVILLVAAVATFMAMRVRKQKLADAADDARIDAKRWCDMLGGQLSSLSAGDDAVATRALSDAAGLYATAMSQMTTATSYEQFRHVRLTATNGLHYVAAARARLGLVAGPQGPPPLAPDGRPMYEEGYWAAPTVAEIGVRNSYYEPRGRTASIFSRRVGRLMRNH